MTESKIFSDKRDKSSARPERRATQSRDKERISGDQMDGFRLTVTPFLIAIVGDRNGSCYYAAAQRIAIGTCSFAPDSPACSQAAEANAKTVGEPGIDGVGYRDGDLWFTLDALFCLPDFDTGLSDAPRPAILLTKPYLPDSRPR